MKRNHATKWILAGMAALTGLMGLAGCSRTGPSGGRPRVRVGFLPNATHAAPLVGFSRAQNTFRKTMPDVALEPKVFKAGPEIVEALRAGALDLAYVGPGPAITAYWSGRDIVILAGSASGGSVLVARPGLEIISVVDLAGKKVAVPALGNTQDVLLRYQLALNGQRTTENRGKVTVRPTPSAETLALFQRDQLDAALAPEPWGSRLEREAGATVVLGSAEIFNEGHYPSAVLVAREDFAEQNPEIVKAFIEANRNLTRDIGKDPAAAVKTIGNEIHRHTGQRIHPDDIRRGLQRCQFAPDITQHQIHVFANLVAVAGYKTDITASLDGILWKPNS